MVDWVGSLCRLPLTFRGGEETILELFELARPYLNDQPGFLASATAQLLADVHLVDAWQRYSADKRTSKGPYFGREGEPFEVGFHDAGFHDVRICTDPAVACADFIYREAAWVLTGVRAS